MDPVVKTSGGYESKLIFEDENLTVKRVIWPPGSRSPKHDHGVSMGSVLILSGQVFEIREGEKLYYERGEVITISPLIPHIMGNDSDEPAESIQVYSPKLEMQMHPDDFWDKTHLQ